jgi:hypothetical protein
VKVNEVKDWDDWLEKLREEFKKVYRTGTWVDLEGRMKTEKRLELSGSAWQNVRTAMSYLDTYNNSYKAYVYMDKAVEELRLLREEFETALEQQKKEVK